MNDVKRTIRAYLEEHRTEIVSLLRDLISIPSVRGEAVPGAPFGTACADILRIIEPHFRDAGCDTELDNDGGYLLGLYVFNNKISWFKDFHRDNISFKHNYTNF